MKIQVTEIATGKVVEYPCNDSDLHFCGFLSRELYAISFVAA